MRDNLIHLNTLGASEDAERGEQRQRKSLVTAKIYDCKLQFMAKKMDVAKNKKKEKAVHINYARLLDKKDQTAERVTAEFLR